MANNTQPTLSVIIPVYNENITIHRILSRVQAVPIEKEIIIVDDFSNDGTREILKSLQNGTSTAAVPSPKVFFHDLNQGKGAAIRTGLAHVTGKITIVQDADMEYDPAEIPKIIQPILDGQADVVYGSRFGGERARVLFFWHRVGNALLTLLSNMCTNLNLTDMETCYKAMRSDLIKTIPIRSNRFGFEPEITAKVAKLRCSVYEVPISYHGRTYAEGKKINWKDGLAAIYTILKFWLIDDLYEGPGRSRSANILEGAGRYNHWLFRQVSPFLGQRVLELAAGVGHMTKYLLNREKVIVTDSNPLLVDELTSRYKDVDCVLPKIFDVNNSTAAQSIRKNDRPDSVLYVNALRFEQNAQQVLKNINQLLSEKGMLVLVVPAHACMFSEMDKNAGAVQRFSQKAITTMLEQAGFAVATWRYLNMLGAIAWFLNGKILKRKLVPSRQIRFFDWFIGLLKIEKMFKPPFGLSILITAEKKHEV